MTGIEPTTIARVRAGDTALVPGYRLEDLIARGGMGEVYRGIQLSLGRRVAIKLLPEQLAREEAFVARFEKEAAALASLSHPNIVSIVDKGHTASTYYLVMEYVDGPSLREVATARGLEPVDLLRILLQVARAVDYAHGRGVIHRDLKPENVIFDEQAGSIPKISDFGLAAFLTGDAAGKFALTDTNVAMGTVAYMAPEQCTDARKVDGRADVYSLGVVLYELLAGDLPRGHFDPPSSRRPGVPREIDAIVERCLKPNPADRYASMAALVAALEPLVPPTSSLAPRRLSAGARFRRAVVQSAHTAARRLALLTVLLAAAVLSVAALRLNRPPRPDRALRAAPAALDLPPAGLLAAPGSLTSTPEARRLAVGAGPDQIPLLARGRPVSFEAGALTFGAERDSDAGRASPEVANLEGDAALLTAEVAGLEPPVARLWDRARDLLLGERRAPQAALMLQGAPGHYVALLVPAGAERTSLEWSLGGRQGWALGPPVPRGPLRLEMAIDRDGELRASVGEGAGRASVGEPLRLGSPWTRAFEAAPKPALACLAARCRFQKMVFESRRFPQPPADAPPPAAVGAPERPPEAPKLETARAEPRVPPSRQIQEKGARKLPDARKPSPAGADKARRPRH